MATATIKIFLAYSDQKRLRTAELSNWTGNAVAGPRSEFDDVIARDESSNSGIYFLTGVDPETGNAAVYIGVAESIKDRVKSHLDKDFWNQIVYFISKDENLTRAHILYCEGRLIEMAKAASRATVINSQSSGSKLPESDRADMEIFLEKMLQLLPALGVELFVLKVSFTSANSDTSLLTCEIKGLRAIGYRTPNGIVVLKGSQAVLKVRGSTNKYPWAGIMRDKLLKENYLEEKEDHLLFVKDTEFSSPSAAAAIHGGQANGLTAWKNNKNISLKQLGRKLTLNQINHL